MQQSLAGESKLREGEVLAVKASDILDAEILQVIDEVKAGTAGVLHRKGLWTSRWDLDKELPQFPSKVILAKCRSMIKRGVINGCCCGCRGDFERVEERARY